MFKKILTILALAVASLLPAQQPQTNDLPPTQPIFATNAKYTNGVAPGYWPTANSTGLVLNISSGTANCSGIVTYAGGMLTMTNNTTNYVYLDANNSCIPSVSTSVFTSSQIPLAQIITSGGNITAITDVRTMFFPENANITGNLMLQVVPPVAGQYVVIYPNSVTAGGIYTCTGGAAAGSALVSSVSPFSGSVSRVNSSPTGCPATIENIWNEVTLPSGIATNSVTAIYGGFVSTTQCAVSTANNCGFWAQTINGSPVGPGTDSWPLATYAINLCSGGACGSFNYSAVQWIVSNDSTLDWAGNPPYGGSGTFQPVLFVYYTGTPVTPPNQVIVQPPLDYNQDNLSLPLPFNIGFDSGTSTAYVVNVPAFSGPVQPGTTIDFYPLNNNSSTTPTMNFNGSGAVIIEGSAGASLSLNDISSLHVATVKFDLDGKWRLQNPQVSGNAATPLSVNGSQVTNPNFNGSTPSPDANFIANTFKVSASSIINETPYATDSTFGVIKPDGTSCTVTSGVLSCTGSGGGAVPTNVIYASAGNGTTAGCVLNTNLLTGGGTDATSCLQAQLDYLGSHGGGQWILNGPALISNAVQGTTNSVDGNVQTTCLQTHTNVTIYVPTGGGVYLANGANCTMLGNNIIGTTTASAFQTNMRVLGGFWNGNNANQSQFEQGNSANQWNFGFWFGGFNGLEISGVTLYNVATFNINLSNGENFVANNDTVTETTTVPGLSVNQDGIHFWGTLTNGVVNNFTDNGGDDDPLAFNTDEGVANFNTGTWWHFQRAPNSGGAISNILVDGHTVNGTNNVMRFFGEVTTNGVATLSNIAVRNVSGTAGGVGVNNSGLTGCSNILIDNWTAANGGTIVNPNLSGSSCTTTAGQQGFGTLATAYVSSGGAWNLLNASAPNGSQVGLVLGRTLSPGSGDANSGELDFFPTTVSTAAGFWQLSILSAANTLRYYGSGDLSLTGSDCGSFFCLPSGGGIKQVGGVSSNCYATDGSTPACGGALDVNGSPVSSPNFNGITPSAPSGAVNNTYQVSSSSVSSYTPAATGSTPGVIKPDGTTCTVTSGVLTCTGSSGSTSIAVCSDTSGSGTAQSCTTSPSFTPVAGSVIVYTTSTPNSGTSLTINVNSLGAKPVAKWQNTTTLAAHDILSGVYVLMTYDGTNWEASTIGNAPSGGGGNYVNIGGSVTWSGCTFSAGACAFSSSSAITISSIPGTYLHLRVVVSGFDTAANTGTIVASFNGDTTSADYLCQRSIGFGTNTTAAGDCSSQAVSNGASVGNWGQNTSPTVGGSVFEIPFYTSTTLQKVALGLGMNGTNTQGAGGVTTGAWLSTAAITSIKLVSSDGNSVTGSIAIYGEN